MELPRMTEQEIRQFVLNYCDGNVFTSSDVKDATLVGMVFMAFLLDGEGDYSNVVLLWEHASKAGPSSINGMPCFTSHHCMSREDLEIVVPMIKAELARRKAFLDGATPQS